MNLYKITRQIGIFSTFALVGILALSLLQQVTYAQEQEDFGQTWMALALAVISLATNAMNFYLAQKAKYVGLNPNSTDEKIMKQVQEYMEITKQNAGGLAQLTNFVFREVAPQKAQDIVEGTLPLIKVKELTANVDKADKKLQKGEQLLNVIQANKPDTEAPVDEKLEKVEEPQQ